MTRRTSAILGPGRPLLLGVVLVLLTVAAYWPVFSAGFIWDDDAYVVENGNLEDLQGLGRIWGEPKSSPQYYPLVFSTFWIERQLFGSGPLAHHTVNIVLHIVNGLWVWAVLRRLRVPGAYVVALFFAVHPVHLESVAWITERKNVLSGFFYLAAMWLYLGDALPEAGGGSRHRGVRYAEVLLLFVCALLSKTVTATWPIVVAILLWWQHGRLRKDDLLPLLPFGMIGGAFGVLTAWLEVHHVGASGAEWTLSPLGRLLLASRIPWFYASTLFWPQPLVFVYPRWTVDSSSLAQYGWLAASVGLVSILWLARRSVGRGPLAAVACFVVTLGPVLGFLNVYPMRYSYVADHFQYLASVAVLGLIVASVTQAFRRERAAWLLGVGIAIALALVATTRVEARKYDGLEALWRDTLAKNPEAWIAHNNLGNVLLKARRYEEARAAFGAAIALEPHLALAYNNLGTAWFYEGHLAEATEYHRKAVELDGAYAEARNNLGVDLGTAGKVAEAIEQYRRAIAIDPTYAMAHYNLGNAFVRLGDESKAEAAYREAIRHQPDMAMAHFSLGLSLLVRGQREAADAALGEAFRLKPEFAQGHYQVGNAALRLGDLPRAIAHYGSAIRLKPDYAEAHSNLGAAYMRQQRVAEATTQYELALRHRPDYPIAHFNLGAALEEQGRVQEAAHHYREALRLDPQHSQARANLERVQRAFDAGRRQER